jgi:hypothetical protein
MGRDRSPQHRRCACSPARSWSARKRPAPGDQLRVFALRVAYSEPRKSRHGS